MFKRILVPLDGSSRAESALPIAARVARAYGGSMVLLRVATTPVEYGPYIAPPSPYAEETVDAEVGAATRYLEGVAQSEVLAGIQTEVHALFGAVAPTIISAAQQFHASIIVMCSHGYTGFKRWMLGGVADIVTRHAPAPVLVLREGAAMLATSPQQPIRAVVPLDGSPLAEAALEPAIYLVAALVQATAQPGELHLLRVVDLPFTSGRFRSQVYIDSETREKAKEQAEAYLKTTAERLREVDLENLDIVITSAVEFDPDVAEAIVKVAEGGQGQSGPYDLIAMATHGRSGVQHFVMGSVTERVLHASRLPLMVVRPEKMQRRKAGEEGMAVAETTGEEAQSWTGLL